MTIGLVEHLGMLIVASQHFFDEEWAEWKKKAGRAFLRVKREKMPEEMICEPMKLLKSS